MQLKKTRVYTGRGIFDVTYQGVKTPLGMPVMRQLPVFTDRRYRIGDAISNTILEPLAEMTITKPVKIATSSILKEINRNFKGGMLTLH
jgi:hypothetical protein